MFHALRRCPASLSRNVSSVTLLSRVLRPSLVQTPSAIRLTTARLPIIATQAFHQSAKWHQTAAAEAPTEQHEPNDGPVTRFKDLALRGLVHPNVVNTITRDMKLETMTDVQTRTINEALSGADMYASPV